MYKNLHMLCPIIELILIALHNNFVCYFSFCFFFEVYFISSLEKEMATHSSIFAWKIAGTEERGRLQSMGLQRLSHDWSKLAHISSDISIAPRFSFGFYLYVIFIFITSLWVCVFTSEVRLLQVTCRGAMYFYPISHSMSMNNVVHLHLN